MKIVWTVFEKFEIFIERSGEQKDDNYLYALCVAFHVIGGTEKKRTSKNSQI